MMAPQLTNKKRKQNNIVFTEQEETSYQDDTQISKTKHLLKHNKQKIRMNVCEKAENSLSLACTGGHQHPGAVSFISSEALPKAKHPRLERKNITTSSSNNYHQDKKEMVFNQQVTKSRNIGNSSAPIPSEVLHQLCMSRFLSPSDLSRFLLLGSKTFVRDLGGHEELWSHLCYTMLGDAARHLPQSLIQRRGYKWIIQQLQQGLARNDISKKSYHQAAATTDDSSCTTRLGISNDPNINTSLKYQDLVFILQIKSGKRRVAVEVIDNEAVKDLICNGPVLHKLTRITNDITFPSLINNDLSCSIHAFRLDTYQCCCLFDSNEQSFIGAQVSLSHNENPQGFAALTFLKHLASTKVGQGSKPFGCLQFIPQVPPLAVTDHGMYIRTCIETVFSANHGHSLGNRRHIGIRVEPQLLFVVTPGSSMKTTTESSSKRMHRTLNEPKATHVCIQLHHVLEHLQDTTAASYLPNYHLPSRRDAIINAKQWKNNISLNLINELYGWQEEPRQWEKLRFKVNDIVWCKMINNNMEPETWKRGRIHQVWCQIPSNGENNNNADGNDIRNTTSWVPYKVLLDDLRFIFVTSDTENMIRTKKLK